MLTIWKYETMPDVVNQVIEMPKGATILSFGVDPRGKLCFWAQVDSEARMGERVVSCIGTGWGMDSIVVNEGKFIGTAVRGDYVWHFFDLGEVNDRKEE